MPIRNPEFGVVALILATSGSMSCVEPFEFEGAPCPCVDGYVCDRVSNLCRPDSAVDDAGTPYDAGEIWDTGPRENSGLCEGNEAFVDGACHRYIDVETDFEQTCVVEGGGRVACFGACMRTLVPRYVEGIDDAVELRLNGLEYCALRRDGRVSCWATVDQAYPCETLPVDFLRAREIGLPQPAVDLANGSVSACAFFEDGQRACWGSNTQGEFGTTSSVGIHPNPILVDDGSRVADVAAVSARGRTTCVVHGRNASQLTCWGFEPARPTVIGPIDFGEPVLAIQTFDDAQVALVTATSVQSLRFNDGRIRRLRDQTNVVDVTAGCLLFTNGEAACYDSDDRPGYGGANFWGVVAEDDAVDLIEHPSDLAIRKMSSGPWHGCFLDEVGEVYCFGDNGVRTGIHRIPSGITHLKRDRQTSETIPAMTIPFLGRDSATGVTPTGQLMTWGASDFDHAVLARRGHSRALPGLADLDGAKAVEATFLGEGSDFNMLVLLDTVDAQREVWSFGRLVLPTRRRFEDIIPHDHIPFFDQALSIEAASARACARMPSGAVRCMTTSTTTVVRELQGATSIAVERNNRYVIGIVGGRLACVSTGGTCPVTAPAITDAVEVVAGDDVVVVRRADGHVGYFGADSRFGAPDLVEVVGIDDAKGIAAHTAHFCAFERDGRTVCWGSNDLGRISPETTIGTFPGTAPFELTGRFHYVDVGKNNSCAVRQGNAQMECWGANYWCQLGLCPGLVHQMPIRIADAPAR